MAYLHNQLATKARDSSEMLLKLSIAAQMVIDAIDLLDGDPDFEDEPFERDGDDLDECAFQEDSFATKEWDGPGCPVADPT